MRGKFYGVGVGPGDPELVTLRAIRCIRESDVIAVAVSKPDSLEAVYWSADEKCVKDDKQCQEMLEACIAYQIVYAVCPEIAEKPKLFLPMPMMKEKEVLKEVHDHCADKTAEFLQQGKQVTFITLGDPTIYSTCLYVQKRLASSGFETVLVPGVPSFCAAAARIGIGIAENREEIHIIPASYQVEDSLRLPGTKILMKTGTKMKQVKEAVAEQGLTVRMVENCGMETEQIYDGVEDIPEEASYYSLMIVKEAGR